MRASRLGSLPSFGVCTSTRKKSLWSIIVLNSSTLTLVYLPLSVVTTLPTGIEVAVGAGVGVEVGCSVPQAASSTTTQSRESRGNKRLVVALRIGIFYTFAFYCAAVPWP